MCFLWLVAGRILLGVVATSWQKLKSEPEVTKCSQAQASSKFVATHLRWRDLEYTVVFPTWCSLAGLACHSCHPQAAVLWSCSHCTAVMAGADGNCSPEQLAELGKVDLTCPCLYL
ncbi:Hypothetical predicted protein [Podarcis lilfordi]|uniref:Secreted protein n=1 Tax=Podarcis lilfordi TaxID=74358 RepID=A0AA35PTW2_9SAUR|nr:Hypothetical predicted protein [Podarcis lilfordi]